MKRKWNYQWLFVVIFLLAITSCNHVKKEGVEILKQSDFPAPLVTEVMPDTFTNFGQQRIDDYFWLKDKNNPKVIDYLNAENAYTDTVMASTKGHYEIGRASCRERV